MSKQVNLHVFFPEEESDNQWIIDLIACLRFACQKVLDNNVTCNIQTVDLQKPMNKTVAGQDYFIVILGSDSNDNEHFQGALDRFCNHFFTNDFQQIFQHALFKILLEANSKILQPEKLKPYKGYEFFDYSPGGGSTRLYEIASHDIRIWSSVLDIVYDIKQTIRISEESEDTVQFAYLANCSVDQKTHLNDIRRELQHFNFTVLPLLELPDDTELMQKVVDTALDKCILVIQILGERYGEVKKGDKISLFEKENNIIQEYLKAHPNKFRLIWKPADLKLTDTRQNLYLNRLMKDGTSVNSKIIEASLDEFKDIIARNIQLPETVFEDENITSGLYVMCKKSDTLSKLESIAKLHHIKIVKENEQNGELFYLNHLKNLKILPNLAIFYPEDSLSWLNSKLGDIVKVIGMGRNIPLKTIAVLGSEKPDLDEYTKWLPGIEFYDINSDEALETYIKKCKD